jgi:hypothetical protein
VLLESLAPSRSTCCLSCCSSRAPAGAVGTLKATPGGRRAAGAEGGREAPGEAGRGLPAALRKKAPPPGRRAPGGAVPGLGLLKGPAGAAARALDTAAFGEADVALRRAASSASSASQQSSIYLRRRGNCAVYGRAWRLLDRACCLVQGTASWCSAIVALALSSIA